MTGKPIIDKILMALNLVVIIGALGLVVKANFLTEPPPIDPVAQEKMLEAEINTARDVKYFKLDKLTVNLPSKNKRLRYLDVEIHLKPFKNSQLSSIEQKKSRISDSIIDIVSKMTPHELNTLSGKILLEQRIKSRINKLYPMPTIEKIFYSRFIIQ